MSQVVEQPLLLNEDGPSKEEESEVTCWQKVFRSIKIAGPGMVVMLADTDAGCLITAGQTGAQWGYSLIPMQIALIPVVFMAQELAVRCALCTGKGAALLIKEEFGTKWAWFATITIVITCIGAIISEISGFVGVCQLIDVPEWAGIITIIAILLGTIFTGSYDRVENVALVFGAFELVFIVTMIMAAPAPKDFTIRVPITDPEFLYIAAANVGAVVMPWMIFYQQSAIVDKKINCG
jgi:NRAMP (natural resistance-associated macrophage protein)-like metal ion transporter